MSNTKQNIVGIMPDFSRRYFDGAKWSENPEDAYQYNERNEALSDWFDVDKRKFVRVFICNATEG